MSQQTIESVIGRLACDEEFRQRFAADRAAVLDELTRNGSRLNPVERRALLGIDSAAFGELAERLDPRIWKVSLRSTDEQAAWSPPPGPDSWSNDKGTAELGEIVVFVDGRTEIAGILEFASVLAQQHDARLTGVFIQPEPAVSQAEMFARGKGILDVIETHRVQLERIEPSHLARHGAQVEVRRLSSGGEEVGHLLLAQAAAFGADLVVMGAYGHSHLTEWIFGGVTRTVLGEASLPVLMSR